MALSSLWLLVASLLALAAFWGLVSPSLSLWLLWLWVPQNADLQLLGGKDTYTHRRTSVWTRARSASRTRGTGTPGARKGFPEFLVESTRVAALSKKKKKSYPTKQFPSRDYLGFLWSQKVASKIRQCSTNMTGGQESFVVPLFAWWPGVALKNGKQPLTMQRKRDKQNHGRPWDGSKLLRLK